MDLWVKTTVDIDDGLLRRHGGLRLERNFDPIHRTIAYISSHR